MASQTWTGVPHLHQLREPADTVARADAWPRTWCGKAVPPRMVALDEPVTCRQCIARQAADTVARLRAPRQHREECACGSCRDGLCDCICHTTSAL